MDQPGTSALSVRPHFTRDTRRYVIERARDAGGHVICACCETPIRDNQQITINHRDPWAHFKDRLGRSAEFLALTPRQQRVMIQNIYNNVGNLEPLHAVCHMRVDGDPERIFTPEEAERLNRRLNPPKTAVNSAQRKGKVTPVESTLPPPLPSETEIAALYSKPFLNNREMALLEQLPDTVRASYHEVSVARIEETSRLLDEMQALRPESLTERHAQGKTMDRLVYQKHWFLEQVERLDHPPGTRR